MAPNAGGGLAGCEWEVTSMVKNDPGDRVQDKHACGAPAPNLARRDDFRRPIATCVDHVARATKYGFSVEKGHK